MRTWCPIVLSVFLAGCAAVSEDQCRSGNWEQIGYDAGRQGKDRDFLIRAERACLEYDIAADTDRLYLGYREGLRDYCRFLDAYELGLSGRSYYGVCNNPRIQRDYNRGREVYLERQEQERREQRIRDLNDDIARYEQVLIDPNSTEAARQDARNRLVRLRKERDNVYYRGY